MRSAARPEVFPPNSPEPGRRFRSKEWLTRAGPSQLTAHDFARAMVIRPAEPELMSWLPTITSNASWVESLDRDGGGQTQAHRALREIGTNAVPVLLRRVRTDDAAYYRLYREIWRKGPDIARTLLPRPKRQDYAKTSAPLSVLGPPAVPLLVAALDDPSFHVRLVALDAMARMGADANPAVPRLVQMLTAQETAFHSQAMEALVRIGLAAVPALVDLSRRTHESPIASSGAIPSTMALAHMGLSRIMIEAGHHGPHLAFLTDGLGRDSEGRCAAAMALWQFHRDSAGMGVLAARLKTATDAVESINIIRVLGEMGRPAAPAVPAILEAVANQDRLEGFPVPMRSLSEIAREALAKIDPGGVLAGLDPAPFE